MIDSDGAARQFTAERCDQVAMERLEALITALQEENEKQNLVSRGSLAHIWRRHIADSAQLLDHVPRETGVWLDLGAGAGFPGLVIAAMRPDAEVVLVESRARRVEWLARMAAGLGLKHCRIEGKRLELVEAFPASIISARAFAPLPKLFDLSARFSTADTTWVLPKGRSAQQELSSMPKRFGKMFHVEQSLTDDDAGIIVGKLTEGRGYR